MSTDKPRNHPGLEDKGVLPATVDDDLSADEGIAAESIWAELAKPERRRLRRQEPQERALVVVELKEGKSPSIILLEVDPKTIEALTESGTIHSVRFSGRDAIEKVLELHATGKIRAPLSPELKGVYEEILRHLPESPTAEPPLPRQQERAITKGTMEFSAQEIIDKALAASTPAKPGPQPPHKKPDTVNELETVISDAEHLHAVLGELRERQIPFSAAEAEVAIKALHEISTRSAVTAWRLGLHAVDRDLISQRKLAGLLNATTATVSLRYREGLTADEEQKIARPDRRTLPL